jgi:hypothetical protein
MDVSTISVIGGLAVSAITVLSTVWGNYYTKKKEQEKEIMLKVLENSFKEYEFRTNHAIEEAKNSGRTADLYPYDYYLMHFAQLVRLIEKGKLTEENIIKVVQDQKMFRRVYKSELEKSEMYDS